MCACPRSAGQPSGSTPERLGPAQLQGQVVLFNFWTLTCINWLRQEPYVRAWSQAYGDDGLIVIGAHTPEFSFEHDIDAYGRRPRIGELTTRLRSTATTRSGAPSTTIIGRRCTSLTRTASSATTSLARGYEQSERVIQRLLEIEREPLSVKGLGVEAEANWDYVGTPETYLGQLAQRSLRVAYRAPWAASTLQ